MSKLKKAEKILQNILEENAINISDFNFLSSMIGSDKKAAYCKCENPNFEPNHYGSAFCKTCKGKVQQ